MRVPSSNEETSPSYAEESTSKMTKPEPVKPQPPQITSKEEKQTAFENLSPAERASSDRINAKLADLERSGSSASIDELFDLIEREAPSEQRQAMRRIRQDMASNEAQMAQSVEEEEASRPLPQRVRTGFLAMGEDDENEEGEDEVFEGNEMTSTAHGELEQHRELREYARITAWEMPMLSSTFPPLPCNASQYTPYIQHILATLHKTNLHEQNSPNPSSLHP